MKRELALALLLSGTVAQAQTFEAAPFEPATLQALIKDAELDEISGLAASRKHHAVFWVHNDAPRPALIHALTDQGQRLGSLRIEGVRAIDWEDIATYSLNGKSWLLIGDIGDNAGVRPHYELIAIEEPDEPPAVGTVVTVKPAWRLRFRYADGAHDCEAMAVDIRTRTILLLTKRTEPPVLYSLPLGPNDGSVMTATRLTEVSSIPRPTVLERAARFPAARYGGSPTSMDIDATGRRAVVLTYRDLWVFNRAQNENWTQAFTNSPQRFPLPSVAQAEAVGFDHNNHAVFVSSERLPAPWLRFAPKERSD
jgi:hypothetical protein